jgi:hypothetical protein
VADDGPVTDDELLARQAELQREAEAFVAELRLVETLGRMGRVVPLGSAVTGLMVWRDLDFGVEAPDLAPRAAWEAMVPVLSRCSALRYERPVDERRHYLVARIDGWKVDLSVWDTPIPPAVEEFQAALITRLTPEIRLAILRLKEAWHRQPSYPEVVSAWQIYDAVLEHEARTLAELDAYLAARGFPTCE